MAIFNSFLYVYQRVVEASQKKLTGCCFHRSKPPTRHVTHIGWHDPSTPGARRQQWNYPSFSRTLNPESVEHDWLVVLTILKKYVCSSMGRMTSHYPFVYDRK